jgi:hypothetical protein
MPPVIQLAAAIAAITPPADAVAAIFSLSMPAHAADAADATLIFFDAIIFAMPSLILMPPFSRFFY